jgi:hypothetical protein
MYSKRFLANLVVFGLMSSIAISIITHKQDIIDMGSKTIEYSMLKMQAEAFNKEFIYPEPQSAGDALAQNISKTIFGTAIGESVNEDEYSELLLEYNNMISE